MKYPWPVFQGVLVLTILFSTEAVRQCTDVSSFSQSFNASGAAQFNSTRTHAPEAIFRTADRSISGARIRGIQDKRNADFVVGGLFPVHSDRNGINCGQLRTQGGVDRVEAMLFALDSVNADPCLLPNITLGYDIRDTCFVEQIGLDEAADLILTGTHSGVETGCSAVGNQDLAENSTNEAVPFTIGLVGAASSPVSISIASLSRLFNMPQISYSSTSATLSNRERYTYFYRTVPSDVMEGRAIIDLLQHFDWTFISTIFSRNSYGQSGIDDLHMLATENGICIDLNEGIEENFNEVQYRQLVDKLLRSTANVVVFYATEQHVRGLFDQLANITQPRHFTWIATSAWAQLAASSQSLESSIVSGLFGIIPSFEPLRYFQDYYSHLTPTKNPRNPWFQEYFQNVFNCSGNCENETNTSLSETEQEYSIPLVIDAVYTYAHALENYLNENCGSPLIWNRTEQSCNGQKYDLNGSSSLLQYIAQVNFTSPTGNNIMFNEQGSVKALYQIINYQAAIRHNSNGFKTTNYNFQSIGLWDGLVNRSLSLKINAAIPVQYGINATGELISGPIFSKCSNCAPGQYLRTVDDSCCGLCDQCLGELFSNSTRSTQCLNCSVYGEMWGDNPTAGSTSCVSIPNEYLQFSHPFSIIISIGSVAGLIVLIVAIVALAIHWKSPVIIASSRESVILVLIGAGTSFGSSFIYLSPPSITICTLQRILLWFSFSLMYGSLLIKVIRISRIFVFQKSSLKKLVCVQTHHQVIFSLLLVAGQMVIVLLSLVIVNPRVLRKLQLSETNANSLPEIVVTCQPEPLLGLLASVLYEAGLILITVVLGTITFKSPANFNESKSTCVSAYILLIIWTMFFVSYTFTLESLPQLQNAFIALTNTLGAYTILGSVIGPRIFIVLFWKERNSKHFSRRATEGDVCASRDNMSSISGGMTLDTEINTEANGHHHDQIAPPLSNINDVQETVANVTVKVTNNQDIPTATT